MSAVEDFIKSYRGPGFRVGKQLRMKGAGYTSIYLSPLTPDEKRVVDIIEKMSKEDAAAFGRIIDASWYEKNQRDILMLEAKKRDEINETSLHPDRG